MRGHRHVAPHAGSTSADLPHQTRGRRAVAVILPRDIHVRGTDRFSIQLVAGEAVAPLDQSPPSRDRALARAKRSRRSTRRHPIL